MVRLFISAGLILFLSIGIFSQKSQSVNLLVNQLGATASVGAILVDLSNDQILDEFQSSLMMTPASLTKLVTTSVALTALGKDYRFNTPVYYSGGIKDGVCLGDLIIKGGGDPTLGSDRFYGCDPETIFSKIYSSVRAKGINSFSGNLIVNVSLFSQLPYPAGRLWDDIGNYYGAMPSALTYRENTISIFLNSPIKEGSICSVVGTDPVVTNLKFNCMVQARGSRDSAYVYGVPGLNTWGIQGSIPPGRTNFKIKGAMPVPPHLFASDLRDYLMKRGISIHGTIVIDNQLMDETNLEVVCSINSPPLIDLLKVINTSSHNLIADHVFLALKPSGSLLSNWSVSSGFVGNYLKYKAITGAENLNMYDGCGLSVLTTISPKMLVEILKVAYHQADFNDYKSTLAVGGQTGTLKNMWRSESLTGRVIGKSGSMTGVLGYAGYFKSKNEHDCAFVIITNHSTLPLSQIRSVIEQQVMNWISEY